MNHLADSYAIAARAQARAIRLRAKTTARRARAPTLAAGIIYTSALAHGSASQQNGHAAELMAARFLRRHGLRILASNLRCRLGELDLVALDGTILVFIEVRARNSRYFGGASASVSRKKQQKIIRCSAYFLPVLSKMSGLVGPLRCRFDVVAIEQNQLDWQVDAFRCDSHAGVF